ncbi:hypothetical protein PIIN_11178 [Serendipita indica DSM 11827]|uniref:Uncharacterized protein n=1 Tax=Serendipita indica (strain DSM 11827) TaxID=1109443 RepID=G4U0V3_SERID|nr:hypothetical protein PIIN_11178 [Serendipita indica DSM 11827]
MGAVLHLDLGIALTQCLPQSPSVTLISMSKCHAQP